jgi:hypothetical protein
MTSTIVYQRSFFADLDGTPLDSGSVYIGTANADPEVSPIQAYWDSGLSVPATQPLSVSAGHIVNAGARAAVYVAATDYSLRARNRAGVQVDYVASASFSAAALGFLQAGTGAVARTAQDKMRDVVSIKDFGADSTGATDCSAAFQSAINQGNVIFPPGTYTMSWAAISADITIPANRKIVVEKGATITNTGGRFTAENVDNVEWQIDGWVKSVAMRTAASKPAWTASVGERGFIEFGSDYVPGTARSGFKVHGSGKVSGDWVYTGSGAGLPNGSDLTTQVNRKGICCWNAANVLVHGLEVYGFDGEAVYANFFDTASQNIVFERLNVHDTRFNALNFNAGANGGGCKIVNNRARNAYAIEASAGEIIDNHVHNMAFYGIWTGAGTGTAVDISRNRISSSGLHGIAAVFALATPVTSITIQGNTVSASSAYSIYIDNVREVLIEGNKCIGTGTSAGGYDIGINHTLRGLVTGNMFTAPGASAQAGRVAFDANSYDVSIDPNTNVYIPTTGTEEPYAGNGVVSVVSAAALTLPALGSDFAITGATTITSIVAAGNNGRTVSLTNAAMTDGSNLKLNGNLVAATTTSITLGCDGTNWTEKGRSVN